jgi:CDP-diacylglycerol---glycerol-3-phosphate 3-phosphatidyltransferase
VNDSQGADGGYEGSPLREMTAAAPPGLVNVANALTVVRILLIPVFVLCLIHGGTGWRLAALAAFGGASLTDFLDGQLARKRGLVTDFGKIADPIADKALTGAALITLSVLGELPGWVTGLILARELAITALRFAVIRRGVIAASQGGKLKTLLQIIAICLYVLPASLGLPAVIKEVVMAAALVVTLVTGADYVMRAVRMRRPSPEGTRHPQGTPQTPVGPLGTPQAPVARNPPMSAPGGPDRENRDPVRPVPRGPKLDGD